MQASVTLLGKRRFLPLFATQFLGAFNDNLFKTALVLLVTFHVYSDPAKEAAFNAVAGGLFILPFLIFSALAGQLAEPDQLETLAVAQEGVAFLSQRPMQESSVARLAIGTPPKVVEGWFSIALCVPERGRYRIEAQAFAASRELKDLLLELWTAAKRR